MVMGSVLGVRAQRCLRRFPKAAVTAFCKPVFDGQQILMFMTAVIGLYLILQTASAQERDVQATEWAFAIQAFGMALVGWAIICLLRAPFIVVAEDRMRGRWHGHRFVYHTPILVATIRAEENGGATSALPLFFDDAEPGSFVYCKVDAATAGNRVRFRLSGGPPNPDVVVEHPTDNRFVLSAAPGSRFGFRLPENRKATMYVSLLPKTVPMILRLTCDEFFLGKHDDRYEPC